MPSLGRLGLRPAPAAAPTSAARNWTCEIMIDLIFPDGSSRQYRRRQHGPRRRRLHLAVAGEDAPCWSSWTASCCDLDRPLPQRRRASRSSPATAPEALEVIRHDTAHVLAEAVQELFPGTQVTIGPNVEDGFYYDFARDEPFSPGRPARIEQRMREIVDRDETITPRGGRPRRGHRRLQGHGRDLQGRDHRRHPRRRGGHGLSPGRLEGPLPRAAPAVDAPRRQGVQADQAGRRLLARRPAQRPAAAHLRHRLGQRGRPGGLPQAHRGGREARPPQARARRWTSSTSRKRARG